MDNNKILLELIKKDLSELQVMVDMLYQSDKFEKLVVELTSAKARSLVDEIAKLKLEPAAQPEIKTVQQPVYEEPQSAAEPVKDEKDEELEPEIEAELFYLDGEVEVCKDVDVEIVMPAPVEQHDEPAVEEVTEAKPEPVQVESIQVEEPRIEIKVEPAKEQSKPEIKAEPELVPTPMPDPVSINNIVTEPAEKSEKKILGEQFVKEPSLNEKLASKTQHDAQVKPQPISSLKSAVGLNDRFLFIRVLFSNNAQLYEDSLRQLDSSADLAEALSFLGKHFEWEKNETSLKFLDLLKRRFSN